MRAKGIVWLVGYIATIFLANYVVTRFGIVPVGFGLMAPAAVFVVGVAFTLRDLVQETFGVRVVLGAILVGALLSALVSPQIALASGVAFLVSELLDLVVYTPLRERNWPVAVGLSNAVGLVADSVIFLALAFGSLEFLPGQVLGKAYMTLLAVAILIPIRRHRVA